MSLTQFQPNNVTLAKSSESLVTTLYFNPLQASNASGRTPPARAAPSSSSGGQGCAAEEKATTTHRPGGPALESPRRLNVRRRRPDPTETPTSPQRCGAKPRGCAPASSYDGRADEAPAAAPTAIRGTVRPRQRR